MFGCGQVIAAGSMLSTFMTCLIFTCEIVNLYQNVCTVEPRDTRTSTYKNSEIPPKTAGVWEDGSLGISAPTAIPATRPRISGG